MPCIKFNTPDNLSSVVENLSDTAVTRPSSQNSQ